MSQWKHKDVSKIEERESIGAYAFATSDYLENDYPLDLWIQWNSKFFDQLAIATYGLINIICPENVMVRRYESPPSASSFDFYSKGKTYAQNLLTTEWKVALDIDEFVNNRIDISRLKEKKAYAIRMRHLYGNLNTEIVYAFPDHYYRIHHGNRKILGDGGAVSPPYSGRIVYRRVAIDLLRTITKKKELLNPFDPYQEEMIDVWHTGALRRPDVMSRKWRYQIDREINSGILKNQSRLSMLDIPFNYHMFKSINAKAELKRVNLDDVPEILRKNQDRFHYVDFDDSEYTSNH